jgi:hypothetical protein
VTSRSGGALALLCWLLAGCAANPHRVASDDSGFALFRSGQLSARELEELCRLGVEEILVLSGDAGQRECRLRQRVCPALRVRYDVAQHPDRPLSQGFLEAFDRWIAESRAAGRKVAIRCRHGWHRAGRLAAYFRIRHQDLSRGEAVTEMNRRGRMMWRFPGLVPQVQALADHAAGRPCSTEKRHCVQPGDAALEAGFPPDVCPEG